MRVCLTSQPILDGILAVSLVVHSHIGFDASIVDYFHPRKWPVIGPMMTWLLRIATGAAVWGLYEFNTNDIGESPNLSLAIYHPAMRRLRRSDLTWQGMRWNSELVQKSILMLIPGLTELVKRLWTA